MYSFSSWFMPAIGSSRIRKLGSADQRARQLDPLLQADRNRVDQFVAHAFELQEVDDLLDRGAVRGLVVAAEPPVERGAHHARPHVHVAAEQDVVEHASCR